MSVIVEERPCKEGILGLLTLDSPATLNALSATMMETLLEALHRWAGDDRICLVMIQGNGDRGFCAGGNIRELYEGIREKPDNALIGRYFGNEYRMDHTLHRYPKPVLCWGHRVVMGGGLGILTGSRYRLVTPDLIMAMPEVSIGLFPDVGSSWFLNRLPEGIGQFMGMTGARLNVSDALRIGMADIAVFPEQRQTLIEQLVEARWSGEAAADDNRLYRLLSRLDSPAPDSLPESNLARHEQTITRLCRDGETGDIVQRLQDHSSDDPWWQECVRTMNSGCPTSVCLVQEQLRRGRQLALKQVFQMELVMAVRCGEQPDLVEGIRARLIDRDTPKWRFSHPRDVPAELVEKHFVPPWPEGDGPLDSI